MRCALVDADGNVLQVLMADPAVDRPADPTHRIVPAERANIGDAFTKDKDGDVLVRAESVVSDLRQAEGNVPV